MNMPIRQISLREFQRNASDYLKCLPVTLVQYNKPVCIVLPIGTSQIENVSPNNDKVSTEKQNVSTHEISAPLNKIKCNFCPNIGATRHSYQFEDGSGDAEADFCRNCWDKYITNKNVKSIVLNSRVQMPSEIKPTEFRGSFPKPVKKKK